jgi:1-pyrroline-5-carboxylate dehydrogenase
LVASKRVRKKRAGESQHVRSRVKTEPKVPRITYATLRITPKDDEAYEKAVALVRNKLGSRFTMYINGEQWASTGEEMSHSSPIDTRIIVSYFPKGTREDVKSAILSARDAFASWCATPYKDRLVILRKAADLIIERRYELSAWMAFEVGKNRAESLAEVNEAAELIRYYCDQTEANKGYLKPLESPGQNQDTISILRPYGVWAVIAPWNFPLALATGMTAGALLAGNTVVFKPSSESPVLGHELSRALIDAGIPRGVFNFVTGPGGTVGAELQENSGVDGLVFTGSKEVGMSVYHSFAKSYPKPVITEMGGKNPAIVTANADLDQAAEGIMRAAFGFGGQKCSACSRVYVAQSAKEEFLELLKGYTEKSVKMGDPTRKETFLGPLINKAAVETYMRTAEGARRDGGRFICGGGTLSNGEFEHGYFVEPAIVDGLPPTHRLFRDELFVPFLVVAAYESFEEVMKYANDSEYGLCAGIYTKNQKEMQTFFDHIEAGVTYANRRAGATTGAWPGVNSFGGWKGSGSTGKSGLGPYYVQQFMREQSRWIVK